MAVKSGAAACDVVVVGAGVIGLSVAYHLAGGGARVVVLERSGVGAGASGVQPGGVRQQWATRTNCLLARESLAFYRELGERLGVSPAPRFRACGYAFVAHSPARLAELEAAVALQRGLGIPSRILTPAETAAVVPELDPSAISGAAWCAEDGYFDRGQAPVEAFAQAARSRGVALQTTEVVRLDAAACGWRLVGRAGERLSAGQVVVAAGLDTPALVRPLGVELPLQGEERLLLLSEPVDERLLDPLVVATEIGLAAKQLADGRVLASDLAAPAEAGARGEGREDGRGSHAAQLRRVRTALAALLPRLQALSFPDAISGLYDMSPDRNALVGPLPGRHGLWVVAGFSGHGFMLAPALGRLLAASVAARDARGLPEAFALGRFASGVGARETQIV